LHAEYLSCDTLRICITFMTWASVAMYMRTVLQQWLHKCALMLHYTCIACLVRNFRHQEMQFRPTGYTTMEFMYHIITDNLHKISPLWPISHANWQSLIFLSLTAGCDAVWQQSQIFINTAVKTKSHKTIHVSFIKLLHWCRLHLLWRYKLESVQIAKYIWT
jgi:hypothetical protein